MMEILGNPQRESGEGDGARSTVTCDDTSHNIANPNHWPLFLLAMKQEIEGQSIHHVNKHPELQLM